MTSIKSSIPIYRVKYLGIVTLKVLPTNCFRYKSE